MKKRALAKRIMTVMLAASMMLSNTATVYATEPTTTQNSQESTGEQTGEDNSQNGSGEENTSTGQNDASAGTSGAENNGTAGGEEGNTEEDSSVKDGTENKDGADSSAVENNGDPAIDKTGADKTAEKDAETEEIEKVLTASISRLEQTAKVTESEYPNTEDILEEILDKRFEEQEKENDEDTPIRSLRITRGSQSDSVAAMSSKVSRGDRLSEGDKKIYDIIKARAKKIADGDSDAPTTTRFIIKLSDLGISCDQTKESLHLQGELTKREGNTISLSDEAYQAMNDLIPQFSIEAINRALLVDCPYELYWYDKLFGISSNFTGGSLSLSNDLNTVSYSSDTGFIITMYVVKELSVENRQGTPYIDLDKVRDVNNTVTNAQAVVDAASNKSDYEKLLYYRDWIAENVSYNTAAATGGANIAYGNPWQIVWVFDNKPETEVVCEGYSKAFQKLCDLTHFSNENIDCYIVTGGMDGGGHMWNHIRMEDGTYYIVDVTNYDDHFDYGNGVYQHAPNFFMGAVRGNPNSGYQLNDGGGNVYVYTYDDNTVGLYSTEELTLSNTAYRFYNVTFNANGHGTAPAKITDAIKGLTISAPVDPVASGYSFAGWYKDSACSAGKEWNFASDKITGDITLYAKWTESRHTITYNPNGGAGSNKTQSVLDNTDTQLNRFSTMSFSKSDYKFVRWNTNSDGSGTSYADGQTISLTADTILYAIWEEDGATAPVITTQPSNYTCTYGYINPINLSVATEAADAGHTLSYQWYEKVGSGEYAAIDGATSTTYRIPTGCNAGKYYYYCVVTSTNNTNAKTATVNSDEAIVTINKAAASISNTRPAAKTSLVYTAGAQELILVNGATPTGGQIQYSLNSSSGFSSSLPTGVNAGAYSVYYKVVGDANHVDTEVYGPINVTIGKAKAKLASATAATKVYDGTDRITLTGGTLDSTSLPAGVVVGVASVSGKLASADAGSGKAVTITGYVLNGADAANFEPDLTELPSDITVNIGKKPVVVSGITAANKEYDRSTTASLDYTNARIEGLCGTDAVTVSSATGTFDNMSAGNSKPVMINNIVLAGSKAGNYTCEGTIINTTATITKKPVSITGTTVKNKEYDGTISAEINSPGTVSGACTGDTLSVTAGTAAFVDANVGTNKPVTFSGFTVDGTNADSYELTSQPLAGTANITKKTLTDINIMVTGTYEYNGQPQNPEFTVRNGAVELNSSDYTATVTNNTNAGTAAVITVKEATNGNYTFADKTENFTIEKAPVVIKADNKSKLKNNDNPVLTATVTGLKGTDTAGETGSTIEYTLRTDAVKNSAAGDYAIEVTTNYTPGNYNVTVMNGTLTITNKPIEVLAVTQSGVTYGNTLADPVFSKPDGVTATVTYSGTTRANLSYAASSVKPTEAGEYQVDVTYETADNTYRGTAAFTISPASIENAVVTLVDLAPVYNGTSQIHKVSTVKLGDTDIRSYCDISGNAIAAGTHTLTVTAKSNSNYTGYVTKEYTIEKQKLTVSGITAKDKVYDGTDRAELITSNAVLTGRVEGDVITVNAVGTFENANVGTGKKVNITSITLSGADASNYFTQDADNQSETTASISAKAVTATIDVSGTYTYTGADITPTYTVKIDGNVLASSEYDVSLTNNKNAGTGHIRISQKTNGNYSFEPVNADFEIGKKSIIISGIKATNKTYNRDAAATLNLSEVVYGGKADGDTLTLSATGAFEDANAGENKIVRITGLTLSGTDAANYVLASTGQQTEARANISKKTITPVIAITGTYTYTGSDIVPNFTVKDGNDALATTDYEAVYSDNKNASTGTAKVTVTKKADGNYDFSEVSQTFDILKAQLTIKADDKTKRHSTTLVADPELTVTITGLKGSDTVPNGTYSISRSSGEDIGNYTIYVSGPDHIENYDITYQNGNLRIVDKETGTLNVTQTGTTYKGTALAAPSYTRPVATGTETLTYTGMLRAGGNYTSSSAPTQAGTYTVKVVYETADTIYTGTSASFTIAPADISSATVEMSSASIYTGSELTQGVTAVKLGSDDVLAYCDVTGNKATAAGNHSLTITAKSDSNYTGSITKTYTINKKTVRVTSGITASDKTYDGTRNATLNLSGALISGKATGDDLSVTATGEFDSATVGARTVTIKNLALSGNAKDNYLLDTTGNQATTTAAITAKEVTVSGIKGVNKNYDATTTATLNCADAVVTGKLSGDAVTVSAVGSFVDKNAGTNKDVNISSITLGGAAGNNYVLASSGQQATAKASIGKIAVTLNGVAAQNKVYDGNTSATIKGTPAVVGMINGDTVTVDTTSAAASFADKKVGNGKTVTFTGFALSGADAGNYTLASQPANATAAITAKEVTITGVTAANKVYDGTTAATVNSAAAVISGKIDSDNVTVTATGAFSDKNAGTGKPVTFTNVRLAGTDAANYTVAGTGSQISATADITRKAVTVTGVKAKDKEYDGTTTATAEGTAVLSGVINGDSVTVTAGAANFDSADIGKNKTVVFTGYTLNGTDGGNYELSAQPASVKANIIRTIANPTVELEYNSKEYAATALKPGVTVKDGSNTVPATEYTITYGENLNVGSGTVKVKAKDDSAYRFEKEVTFTITAAALNVRADDKTRKYGEKDPTLTYTVTGLKGSDTKETVFSGALNRDAGENVAAYAIKKGTLAPNSNYTMTFSDGTFTITKADHANETDKVEIRTGTANGTLDIAGYLVENAVIGSPAINGAISSCLNLTSGLNSDRQQEYSVQGGTDGMTGSVTFAVSSPNYNDYTITINVTIKAKTAEVVLEKGSTAAQTEGTGVKHVSAEGLSELTNELGGSTAVLKMVVKPKADAEVPAQESRAVNEKADAAMPGIAVSNIKQDYIDIGIKKSEDNGAEVNVTETGKVVEIPVRYDMRGKYSPVVMRVHDGNTSALRKLSSRPAADSRVDGTYFISGMGASTDVYIYSSGFSLYSIAYTDSPTAVVTYDNGIGETNSMDAVIGQNLIKPATPGREGYTFTGWYDSTGALWNFDTGVMADSGITLTAGWSQNSTESQSSGGGSSSSSSDSSDSSSSAPAAVVKKAATDANAALAALLAGATGKNKKKSDVTKSAGKNGTDAVSDADALDSEELTEAGALRAPNTGDTLPNEWILLIIMLMGLALIGYGIREYVAVYRREDR